jgi:outer membrane protein assembly factor BamB
VWGDGELLLVVPEDTEQAVVFAASDGRQLGSCRVPPVEEHMERLGRRVLMWREAGGRNELALVDPWKDEVVWQRLFPPKSQPWPIDGEEVAVLDPQGQMTIFAMTTGEPLVQTQLEPETELDSLFVTRSSRRYVVAANRLATGGQFITHPRTRSVTIHGRVYGLKRDTGERIWTTEIEDQAMRPELPRELPVLVMFNCVRVRKDKRIESTASILALDARTGREVHRQETKRHSANLYQVEGDPERHRVVIRSYVGTVELTLTDEEPPPKPDPKKQEKKKQEEDETEKREEEEPKADQAKAKEEDSKNAEKETEKRIGGWRVPPGSF